jgi:hypothetical protein
VDRTFCRSRSVVAFDITNYEALVDLQIIKIFTCWITQWMAVGSVCHVERQFTTSLGRDADNPERFHGFPHSP